MRRKPFGKLLPSAHAVDREFRVIAALGKQGFPVAKAYALCTDDDVIGAAFSDGIGQKVPIMRDSGNADGRRVARGAHSGVYEDALLTEESFFHDNRVLFAILHALQEEVAIADLPRLGDNILARQQFLYALSNAIPPGDGIEVGTRVRALFLDPFSCARRILIFEPAVGIGDLDAVQNLSDGLDRSGRRRVYYGTHVPTFPKAGLGEGGVLPWVLLNCRFPQWKWR